MSRHEHPHEPPSASPHELPSASPHELPSASPHPHPNELQSSHSHEHPHLQLIRRYFAAIERGADEVELAGFFAPEVRQHEYPNRLVAQGAERDLALLLAGSRKGRQVVAGQRYEVRSALVDGDRVAVELTWTATLKVALAATPVGGSLRADCGVFFRLREGRIVEQHNYDCFEAF